VAAACVLGISDVLEEGGSRRLDDEGLEELGIRLGEAGYAAVSSR
jgi:hypothetical protein